MGSWFSSTKEQKIDIQGQSINVTSDNHDLTTILIIVICAVKLFEFFVFLYRQHTRRLLDGQRNNQRNNNP